MTSKKSTPTGPTVKRTKGVPWILGLVFGLSLFLFCLLTALEQVAYDADYYQTFQEENGIVERAGRTQEELNQVSKDTIEYLQTGEERLMTDNFQEREVHHMVDVFELFELARLIRLISGILILLILAYALYRGEFASLVISSGKVILVLLGILVLIAIIGYLNWNTAFTKFHEIFFDNDLWILDPKTDLMIQMMPTPFFTGMALGIFVRTLVYLLGFYLLAFLIKGRRRGIKTNHAQ